MQKSKSLLFLVSFIALASLSALGSYFSFLMFPGLAFLFYFIIKDENFRVELQTIFAGISLFLVFNIWYIILYDKTSPLHALIFTFALMAAIEAWRFTVNAQSNVWGLMNLVVFWISMEYLMFVWLPFDISSWFIGTTIFLNDSVSEWVKYVGSQGFSLYALIGGLILFKAVEERLNIVVAVIALVFILVFLIIEPGQHPELYAEGEWVGRTCVWISVLILAYSFVKRKTLKKNGSEKNS